MKQCPPELVYKESYLDSHGLFETDPLISGLPTIRKPSGTGTWSQPRAQLPTPEKLPRDDSLGPFSGGSFQHRRFSKGDGDFAGYHS